MQLFYKGYNGCPPEKILKSICTKRVCSYSQRGRIQYNLIVPRFNINFMEKFTGISGTVLWNLVNDKEDCSRILKCVIAIKIISKILILRPLLLDASRVILTDPL